ncbi:MAG: hypothetical protein ACKVTZ_10895 [Bacteroidia bacterium]
MEKTIRQQYNAAFSQEAYQEMLQEMNTKYDYEVQFRVAETPVFLTNDFRDKVLQAGNEIADFVQQPEFIALSESAIPKEFYVPNDPHHTEMIAIDFAICKDELGNYTPQLIEIQGFPSLYGFQHFCCQMYQKHFDIPKHYTCLFGGKTDEEYVNWLKEVILNGHAPENVILLEIEPRKQKTAIDFWIMEAHTGIESVCISEVILEGKKLYYMKNGEKTPIYRIYNRTIFDELQPRTDLKREFNLTEEVDVEWVTHPNWFFRISKYTLPYLKSQFVPSTTFVKDLTEIPSDLENYVLKPLFSFAGQGVIINVKKEDIENVDDPSNWILQKKVQYVPIFEDPNGVGVKAEIRLLYLWDKTQNKCVPATTLGRLSKGLMIGVRYNKDFDWVGATGYFF